MISIRLLLLLGLLFGVAMAACRSDRDPTAATGEAGSSPAAGRAAAADRERNSDSITVAAASDLRRALTAAQPAIEQACGTRLTFVFGSSGQLKEQILAGAPYHLFLSADTAFVEELVRAGRIVEDGSRTYAVGRLALTWRRGLPPMAGVAELTRADIRRVAIANPSHAPYGRAAREAMLGAGVWDGVQGRLVLGENIRQATDYVEQGNADAGIVALALVIDTGADYDVIPASAHQPIVQGGGVVRGSGGEATARCALHYLLDRSGQEILGRFGFEPVPSP